VVVPFARLAGLGPPPALLVLHHQPAKLGVELLAAYGASLKSAFEFSVAALCFPEVYPTLFKIHPSPYNFCHP
jgi:hypothetical protein